MIIRVWLHCLLIFSSDVLAYRKMALTSPVRLQWGWELLEGVSEKWGWNPIRDPQRGEQKLLKSQNGCQIPKEKSNMAKSIEKNQLDNC